MKEFFFAVPNSRKFIIIIIPTKGTILFVIKFQNEAAKNYIGAVPQKLQKSTLVLYRKSFSIKVSHCCNINYAMIQV